MAATDSEINVNCIGMIYEPSGYAKANRHLMIELAKQRVHVRTTPVHPEGARVSLGLNTEELLNSLYHTPLPEKHVVLFNYPASYFYKDPGKYTIGFTMYECSHLPYSWVRRCNMMDEIWVPSSFNHQTFIASGVAPHKIRIMPLGVDTCTFQPGNPALALKEKRAYSFLSICSFDTRKGIDILLNAFLEEFAEQEDVCLIIKTRATTEEEILRQQAHVDRISAQVSGRRRDSVILLSTTEGWTEEKLSQLYSSVNCYVLPTSGEGWNLTVMEAMASGLPVITTRWSAHLDFIHDTNGYLISIEGLVPFNPANSRLLWAIPSKDHLKQLMRHVYTHPDEAMAKGQLGREAVNNHYTWTHSAERILHRLQQIPM